MFHSGVIRYQQSIIEKVSTNAPGTFQHSLQVANLAEEGILKLRECTLVRAGALYHDIGKLKNPQFLLKIKVQE